MLLLARIAKSKAILVGLPNPTKPYLELLRYIALDIHKHYCVVAGVKRYEQVVLQAVQVEHEDLERWLKENLFSGDRVVVESTTNAWYAYALLEAGRDFRRRTWVGEHGAFPT